MKNKIRSLTLFILILLAGYCNAMENINPFPSKKDDPADSSQTTVSRAENPSSETDPMVIDRLEKTSLKRSRSNEETEHKSKKSRTGEQGSKSDISSSQLPRNQSKELSNKFESLTTVRTISSSSTTYKNIQPPFEIFTKQPSVPSKETKPKNKKQPLSPQAPKINAVANPPQQEKFTYTVDPLEAEFLTEQPVVVAPQPQFQIIQAITYQDEEREGSRHWRQSFSNHDAHIWHTEAATFIKKLENRFPGRNIVLTRLTSFYSNQTETTKKELPVIFFSSLPLEKYIDGYQKISKEIFEKKKINERFGYKLRFLIKSFQDGGITPHYTNIKKGLNDLFKTQQTNNGTPNFLGPNRIQAHLDNIRTNDDFPYLYFHSEQAFRLALLEDAQIEKLPNTLYKKPTYVIADLCSLNDMCWCCADSLASACHQHINEKKYFIRCSGTREYPDKLPQNRKSTQSLRQNRQNFANYNQPCTYDTNQYLPYIFHSIQEDFNNQ